MYPPYQYLSDNGNVYQIAQPEDRSAPGAGNMFAAAGTEPLFPAMWTARHMLCAPLLNAQQPLFRVVCNADNPNYRQGPGTTFPMGLALVVVLTCYGETQRDI